ncbi:MAG: phosphopentomutase [Verrucomicrobiota bacterium]
MPKRALLIVLDSVGIGHAPDAASFGDQGANTMGHIRETVAEFSIPFLDHHAGLAAAETLAASEDFVGEVPKFSYGCMIERSLGKDTTTGHWELAGCPVMEAFATFDAFPAALVKELEDASGVNFIGNYSQSGTVILEELGEEHDRTGHPILYTSADSVLQIAAHEAIIPLEDLYEICRACRGIADRERIGRVIARPFVGRPGEFTRTTNRHDFSMVPPRTVLNKLSDAGITTTGVGKIHDIFAGSGIDHSHPTTNNEHGFMTILNLVSESQGDELIFANLVDFDMLYGHRRDPVGYAKALMDLDRWLPQLLQELGEEWLLVITADHGNDPTWRGTDHTREKVPLLVHNPRRIEPLGTRHTFADVAASLADWFGLDGSRFQGRSFLVPS